MIETLLIDRKSHNLAQFQVPIRYQIRRDLDKIVWLGMQFFVLIILYSLYLEYDSPLVPSASGLAG